MPVVLIYMLRYFTLILVVRESSFTIMVLFLGEGIIAEHLTIYP